MRILTMGKRGILDFAEPNNIYGVRAVTVTDSTYDTEIDNFKFDAIMFYEDDKNNEWYIVFDTVELLNANIRRAYETGMLDLSMYEDRTFINPNEKSIERLKALQAQLNPN